MTDRHRVDGDDDNACHFNNAGRMRNDNDDDLNRWHAEKVKIRSAQE